MPIYPRSRLEICPKRECRFRHGRVVGRAFCERSGSLALLACADALLLGGGYVVHTLEELVLSVSRSFARAPPPLPSSSACRTPLFPSPHRDPLRVPRVLLIIFAFAFSQFPRSCPPREPGGLSPLSFPSPLPRALSRAARFLSPRSQSTLSSLFLRHSVLLSPRPSSFSPAPLHAHYRFGFVLLLRPQFDIFFFLRRTTAANPSFLHCVFASLGSSSYQSRLLSLSLSLFPAFLFLTFCVLFLFLCARARAHTACIPNFPAYLPRVSV